MLRKANWDKTLQKSLKFSYCRKSIGKQIRPSCGKNLSSSFCVCLVSWKQRNLEIRANIPKSCRRPVVSLWVGLHVLYNLCFDSFLLICISFVVRTRGIVCVIKTPVNGACLPKLVVCDKISLYCSEFMLGIRTCLPYHIPDRWSRNANRIWPDLAFSFVHKRSGNEIRSRVIVSSSRALCCFLSVKKQKHNFRFSFRSMYNKAIVTLGFCDIQNNQGVGKGYQPQIAFTDLNLDYSGYHKNLIQ